MVIIRCYNRATILWHHFAASKRVSSTYSYFCSSFACSKLLLVRSYYSSPCYYRQPAYVYVAYYVRPDARNVARAVLTRAGSLSPRDQPVVVFPVLGIPASNTVTLIAGCPPKHKTSRLTAAVRRILINDAMTVSTKDGRLMVTLPRGIMTIQRKSNMGQNVIKYDCNDNDLIN